MSPSGRCGLETVQLLQGISLVNIHINEENREDIQVPELTFKNAEDQERAQTLISQVSILYAPCSWSLQHDLRQMPASF